MKLIRDNTPGLLQGPGVVEQAATPREYEILHRMKVMEEAAEVAASTSREELVMELGDLFTIAGSLMEMKGITMQEVKEAAEAKAAIKGVFNLGAILMYDPLDNKHS